MLSVNPAYSSVRPVFTARKPVAKPSFSSNPTYVKNNGDDSRNPINKFGEYCLGIQKSFYKSLKTSGRVFGEMLYYASGTSDDLGTLLLVCGIAGVLCGVGSFIVEFPKNLYEANVNFFAKKEQANADLATYSTQKVLLDQINEKGKTATEEEKQQLAQDLLKIRKNQLGVRDYKDFSPFQQTQPS